jgi:hypothetical protein
VGYVGAVTDAQRSAELIRGAVVHPEKGFTVADASTAAGIPLQDAESGLNFLTSDYRGHLRVSEDGDLVYVFPNGFTKPWETKEWLEKVGARASGALLGAFRFLVRAWLLVVMVAYAALFVALLVGLMFAGRSSDRDDRSGLGDLLGALLRVIFDALYWTFHPWSPFYVGGPTFAGRGAWQERRDEVPFYEKVNRFVFGPTVPPADPHAMRTKVLEEIRTRKGRIGLADVMRVTGLPREQADPLMARLMMDHDGTVHVGEQGGIVYRFESMRRTADEQPSAPQRPAWETPPVIPPLTGNNAGANVGIAALNIFNVLAAWFVIGNGLTIANVAHLFEHRPPGRPPIFEPGGLPIALGVVPLVFSLAVLALPVARAALRGRKEKKVAEEKARLGILREVLARAPKKEPVPDEVLQTAYRVATGETATSKEITKRVVELGGDVDVGPEGEVRYRFADLEAEAEALEEERAAASDNEARLGKIVFTSEN